ncbi:M16 family metallopeptidase [Stakelama marina]|uniref:Insulinase family protein n=1 Tax=Stakelama marina TaxID=2826939 RepID=A0A8T4IFR2_9SPHN|nr:pitrilysin family protein [Stakelama marina]MBR0551086.1 insulinase family protein [Stakelama marina]
MKRALIAIAAALTATATLPATAQEVPANPPPIGTPKPFSLPANETYSLPNGMEVTFVPFGNTPKAVVALRVFAGNLNEADDTWLADLTGDMLKEGAGGMSAEQIATRAAGMGGDLNVSVSPQQTYVAMNVLSEDAADAVKLIGDVTLRPDFPADQFDRVKANWQRRLAQALSRAQSLADAALARAYYGNHPYGHTFPTQEQLAGYTLDQAKAFYDANYGAERAHIYVGGQFDRDAVKAAIAKTFGDWKAGPDRLSLPATPNPGPQVILVDRPGAPQSTIRLAFPAAKAGAQGDIPLRVANALLGGSFSSRITKNIREDKGYTYSPRSSITHHPGDAMWEFDADVTTASTGPALHEVFSEIRKMQGTAPSDQEAQGMRNYLSGLFVIQNSTASSVLSSLASVDTLNLPENWLDNYVPSVLAVTPQQMSDAIKTTVPLDKMTLVVVGDLKTVEPQLKALPELKGMDFKTVTIP